MGYPSKRPCLWLINVGWLRTTYYLLAGMILQVVALEWCQGGVGGPSVFSLMFLQTPLMPLGFCFLDAHKPKINMEPETGPLERKNING